MAQAAWIPGWASVQVLLGKPNPFLAALVPCFLFPHRIYLSANNPSKPIQTPQDFSLHFGLQTALYPSIAFPLCLSVQRSCCWLVLCVSRNANEALSGLFFLVRLTQPSKQMWREGFFLLEFVLALCFLNQLVVSKSGYTSSLFKNFINHTEDHLISQFLHTSSSKRPAEIHQHDSSRSDKQELSLSHCPFTNWQWLLSHSVQWENSLF